MENAAQPSYYEKTLNELLDKIRALDNDIPYTKLEDFEILLAAPYSLMDGSDFTNMQMVDPIIHAEDLKSDDSSEIERNFNKNISFGGWINSDDAVLANYQNGENGEKFLPSKKYLLPEDEINRRIAHANEKIREAAEGIYSGNIAAEPFICKDHSACTYCPFGLSCGRAT